MVNTEGEYVYRYIHPFVRTHEKMKLIGYIILIFTLTACNNKTLTLENQFPEFASNMDNLDIEQRLGPLTGQDIIDIETSLDIELPPSYKRFLKCTRGFWAFGGIIQMGEQHPFFHDFKPFDQLTEREKGIVNQSGGNWPPPSEGMLCFSEFFMESDGDQVLFDIKQKDENGEFPVYYYSHDSQPPRIRKIADSFEQWLIEFPKYEEFNEE